MRSMMVFNFLLEATLIGSVMIVGLMVVRLLFRAKIGSRLIYAAWLVVALRLLIPLSLPNPMMNHLRPGLSTDMLARPVANQIRVRTIDAAWDIADGLRALTGSSSVSQVIRDFGSSIYTGQVGKWFLLVYMMVALSLIAWMACRNFRFYRWVKRNRVSELKGDGLQLYRRLCVRLLAKPVPVYYVDKLKAPCTIGVLRPMIALPADDQSAHLQALLSHQMSHVKFHDGFWALIRNLCCVVHWYNPLVWAGAYLCREDAEMSCDALAVSTMTNGDRIAYAEALASTHGADIHGVALIATDGGGRGSQMKKRMTAVLSNVHVKRWAVVLAGALCCCVLTASFLTGEKYAPVRITVLPQVRWVAGDQNIENSRDAVGYARRFLESPYIGVDTSRFAFTAASEKSRNFLVWLVEGSIASDGVQLTLRFRQDGALLAYDGLYQAVDVDLHVHQETAPVLPDTAIAYLHGFTKACLPHQKWVDAHFEGDALGNGQQLFTLRMHLIDQSESDRLHTAKVTLLMGDEVSIMAFENQS